MFGWTQNEKLLKAAKSGDLERVKYWIEQKQTDVNAENYGQLTPLYLAINGNHTHIVEYLIQNEQTILPAIDVAMRQNDVSSLKYLIERAQININQRANEYETTLLHQAAEYGHVPVVEYLLSIGADDLAKTYKKPDEGLFHVDEDSYSYRAAAIDLAYHYKHKKLVAFMESYAQAKYQDIILQANKTAQQKSSR